MKKYLLFVLLLVLASCQSNVVDPGKDSSTAQGSISLSLSKTDVPTEVATLQVTLSKSGYGSIVKEMDLLTDSSAEISISDLAIGTWHLKVKALKSDSTILYTGESDITISSNEVTTASIILKSSGETGSIYIYVTWDNSENSFGSYWFDQPTNPLIVKTFDLYQRYGVQEPHVLYDGGIYKMWYGGLVDGGVMYIFYATSLDGLQWKVENNGNPVMFPSSSGWDSNNVHPGPVIKENGIYKMYYGGWSNQYSNWSVGLATSTDGINWTRYSQNPIIVGNGWDQQTVSVSIVKLNSTYYLYYAGMSNNSYYYSIGLATSIDGLNWTKEANPIISATESWENGSVCYPNVIYEDNMYKMVYQGGKSNQKFSIAYSNDGKNWNKSNMVPFFTPEQTNHTGNRIKSPNLVKVQKEYRIYYASEEPVGYGMSSICLARKFISN